MTTNHIKLAILGFAVCCSAQAGTINEISAPQGFTKIEYPIGSYSYWISNLPLKQDKIIKAYDGSTVPNDNYNVLAVVEMPLLFQQDLEQCADYCFRFWAEYHQQLKILDKLYLFDYNGNKRPFNTSNRPFNSFLKSSMSNTNSFSIKKGCQEVPMADLKPGDMIVQNEGGGIGHVSVIMSMCKPEKGEALYLIGFSYMPAQEFHIEKATDAYGKQGWFTLKGYYGFLHDNIDLGEPVLRKFAE
jgi:hypothetical protein